MSRVVSLLLEAEAAAEDTPASTSATGALRIIDAFIVPKYRYDPIKKIFLEYVPFFLFIS